MQKERRMVDINGVHYDPRTREVKDALWLLSWVTEGAMGAELTRDELISIIYASYHVLKGNSEIHSMVREAFQANEFTRLMDALMERWQ